MSEIDVAAARSLLQELQHAPWWVRNPQAFKVNIEPRGKGRPRGVLVNAGKGRASGLQFKGRDVRIAAKPDDASKTWEQEMKLKLQLIASNIRGMGVLGRLWEAPLWIRIILHYKRPKSVKKDEVFAESCRIDNDNAEKAVWDAMNGVLFKDDHRIVWNEAVKIWTDCEPSITILIGEVKK